MEDLRREMDALLPGDDALTPADARRLRARFGLRIAPGNVQPLRIAPHRVDQATSLIAFARDWVRIHPGNRALYLTERAPGVERFSRVTLRVGASGNESNVARMRELVGVNASVTPPIFSMEVSDGARQRLNATLDTAVRAALEGWWSASESEGVRYVGADRVGIPLVLTASQTTPSPPPTAPATLTAAQASATSSATLPAGQNDLMMNPVVIRRVASYDLSSIDDRRSAVGGSKRVCIFVDPPVLDEFRRVFGTKLGGVPVRSDYFNQRDHLDEEAASSGGASGGEEPPAVLLPPDSARFSAAHMQMLARNEAVNTDGRIHAHLYAYRLTVEDVAALRCLVSSCVVTYLCRAHHYGGYSPDNSMAQAPIEPPRPVLIVDQVGYQWQEDIRNTGGLFFFPASVYELHAAWKSRVYHVFMGEDPTEAPVEPLHAVWNTRHGAKAGNFCLLALRRGFALEFLRALRAANQGSRVGDADLMREHVHFRFLRAGLGFFMSGIADEQVQRKIAMARVEGICDAIDALANASEAQKRLYVERVRIIDFPFTPPHEQATLTSRTGHPLRRLHVRIGTTGPIDALSPQGVNATHLLATTNTADPHTATGNEGGFQSVDAAIATNTHFTPIVVAARWTGGAFANVQEESAHSVFDVLPPTAAQSAQDPTPPPAVSVPEVARSARITSSAAPCFYQMVQVMHGTQSNIVAEMMALHNRGATPEKMIFALRQLELFDPARDSINYVGDDGYLVTVPSSIADRIEQHTERHLASQSAL